MRSYQGRKCLCCKNCSKCQEFRKVISDNGFDIYIYVKHSKAMTKGNDVVENKGFVFNNMHNIAINKNDILQKIESSELNCPRCKSVLVHVSKILREPIQENKVVVICPSCIRRCMCDGQQRCKFCHRIYDRFISNKKVQGVTTQDSADKWSSEIRHLLAEMRLEDIGNKLISSDIDSQQIKAIASHLPRITSEKDDDVKHEQLDEKIMPLEVESQDIKTTENYETNIPRMTSEIDIDANIDKINLELKNVTQDIKHLSYLSQQNYEEKYGSQDITDILHKDKIQEVFDYVFPKIDFKHVNLGKQISSSELLKEMEEKVHKDQGYDATIVIKSAALGGRKFKTKKQIWTSKRVHIDEEQVKFPSRSESKTQNEQLRRKEKDEKEADGSEKMEHKDIDDKDVPDIKMKRKEKYKAADADIDSKDVLDIKMKRKEKYKAPDEDIDDKIVPDIKVKRKEKYKTDDADIDGMGVPDIKVKRKEKYKTDDANIDGMGVPDIKVKRKEKYKAADAEMDDDAPDIKIKRKEKNKAADKNIDYSDVPEKKRKEKSHKELRVKKQKDGQGSGDGFDLSKIIPKKKKSVDEEENLLLSQKKKFKKGSKLSINDSIQITSKKEKSRSTMPKISDLGTKSKQSEQKSDKLEQEKRKKEKKSNLNKDIKSTETEELKLNQVKIRKTSAEDFHIDAVKIKQTVIVREKVKKPIQQVSSLIEQKHIKQKKSKISSIVVSQKNSESIDEREIDMLMQKVKLKEINEMIIGKRIVKHRKRYLDIISRKKNVQPMLFESTFKQLDAEIVVQDKAYQPEEKTSPVLYRKSKSLHKFTDQEASKIQYKLSNRSFIDKGWTMLPTEKIVRKMNIYRMRPSHPEFDWFEHNKDKRVMHYDTGEILAEFYDDGRSRWFYRNGRLALDYYDAQEVNAGQRYVVYSNGDPDEKGRPRPITVLATFDYLGNGIVFDHTGKVRLKYNQTEGAVLDKDIGPVSHWKWHELNDPPILQKVMIDTQMTIKDPVIFKMGGTGENVPRGDNEEMLAIEFDNFIKEKSKKLTQKFKPFQIKMKALKINENFSLKVLDQATVYLLFRDGSTNLKLNLGMILDHKQIVDTDTAEVGEVTCNLERLPARTDSLAMLQRSIAHAQHVEKLRIERECRYRLSEVKPSIDRLTAPMSRPLKVPVLTEPEIECMCNTRKLC